MTDVERSLEEFHIAFNHIKNKTPSIPSEETKVLRLKLLKEEYEELVEAIENDYLEGILQEAVDLVYVAVGVCTSYGLPFNAGFEEVHRANMRKLVPCLECDARGYITVNRDCAYCHGSGRVSIQSPEGKTLKPSGWKPPDIAGVLQRPL